jgi:hypothetical protein
VEWPASASATNFLMTAWNSSSGSRRGASSNAAKLAQISESTCQNEQEMGVNNGGENATTALLTGGSGRRKCRCSGTQPASSSGRKRSASTRSKPKDGWELKDARLGDIGKNDAAMS